MLVVCTLQQQQHERGSMDTAAVATPMMFCFVCVCFSAVLLQLLGGAPASQLIQFMSAFTDEDLLWRCAGA